MLKKRSVVVTGFGLVTPLGCDSNIVWESLLAGKNGIFQLSDEYIELEKYGIKIAGTVSESLLNEILSEFKIIKGIKDFNYSTKLLLCAGLKALDNAGLEYNEDKYEYKIGAIIANGTALAEQYDGIPYEDRNPKWFLNTYPNLPLAYLAKVTSIKGYGNTIVCACAGGSQAIGEGYKKIQNGEEDILLVGGIDNKLSAPYVSGFSRLNMITKNNNPDFAMRPFDKSRDGFVIGQGACVLVLESFENAQSRGAEIKGKIVGYGCSLNVKSLIDASYEGKVKAMENALVDANLSLEDIHYINAHGTSTLSNDREESIAIKKVFGKNSYNIPINSTKSFIGHTFAASGAIEAFVCLKSLLFQKVHINKNFQEGDNVCDLDYVTDRARNVNMKYCISNSSGVGGYNTTLVFSS